jgi:hypothetical protein
MGSGGIPVGDATQEAGQGRFTRDHTNDVNYRVRGAISWDVRQQTEYGTLRTYIRFGADETPRGGTWRRHDPSSVLGSRVHAVCGLHRGPVAVVLRPLHLRRRLQLPQRADSGDTGAVRQNLWAYTCPVRQRLLRARCSLEDPATRKGVGTIDVTATRRSFGS